MNSILLFVEDGRASFLPIRREEKLETSDSIDSRSSVLKRLWYGVVGVEYKRIDPDRDKY